MRHHDKVHVFDDTKPKENLASKELQEALEEAEIWKRHFEDIKHKYYSKRIEFGLDMIKHLTTLGLKGQDLTDTYRDVMILFDETRKENN